MSELDNAAPTPQRRFGWTPNPEGVERSAKKLRNLYGASHLFGVAPYFEGDGLTGDLMPYMSMYQVEIKSPDGAIWKPKAAEMPYKAQTGENCTSEGTSHALDDLQLMNAADGTGVFHRVAVEATYAFGLSKAGMRGDNGCYGSAMADAVSEIGTIDYDILGAPFDEDGSRLRKFASNPDDIVQKYSTQASAFKLSEKIQITTWEELCSWIANKGTVIVCSNVGFESPRDAKGICRRSGRWGHCMHYWGVIRSDGTETAVQFQSWGPGCPSGQQQPELMSGPQPFNLPSYSFRTLRKDVETQLAAGDSWGFRGFPGFEKSPLPPGWVNDGWMTI